MFTDFGICSLIMLWRTFSFAGRSINLRWILISNLSNVAVPSPHGDLRVVTLSLFVGRGTGPRRTIPDFFEISFMVSQILLSISMLVLLSFTLTFDIVINPEISLKMLL